MAVTKSQYQPRQHLLARNLRPNRFTGSPASGMTSGKTGRKTRVENMVARMDLEGLGSCANTGACAFECPEGISLENITTLNRKYLAAKATSEN